MVERSSFLLLLLTVGTFFLVIPLADGGWFPAWLGTGIAVAPPACIYFGAGAEVDAETARGLRVGGLLQALGGIGYLLLWTFACWAWQEGVSGAGGAIGGMFGLPVAIGTLRRVPELLAGRPPEEEDPLAAGLAFSEDPASPVHPELRERAGGLRGFVAVVGLDTLGMTAIGLAFVAASLLILARRPGEAAQAFVGVAFFGACALVGLSTGIERWAALVPLPEARRAALERRARRVMALAIAVAGVSLIGFGTVWRAHDLPDLARVGLVGLGALCLLAAPLLLRRP